MWPRELPRANMSSQHETNWFRSLMSHTFARASCRPRRDIDTRTVESSLTSHIFARTSCRPEPERLRILVDVAHKWPNKICRGGGIWWHMVAYGVGAAVCPWPAFASQNAEAFRICQISFITPCSLRGRRIDNPSGDHRRPFKFWLVGLRQGDYGGEAGHPKGFRSHLDGHLGSLESLDGGLCGASRALEGSCCRSRRPSCGQECC